MLLISCGDLPDTSVPDETPQGFVDGKGDIYGTDSRRELFDSQVSTAHRRVAQATAVIVGPRGFQDIGGQTATLSGTTLAQKMHGELGAPLCSTERFLDQPAPGYCSAFLIAPDLVATAGHCINLQTPLHTTSFVFGFGYDRAGDPNVRNVPATDVYRGVAVVGHLYNPNEITLSDRANREYWHDWAVIQLDRPVTGRTPVELRTSSVTHGESVTAIGHPSGIPTKVTAGRVVDATKRLYFNTDLDIYQGNSGSLVADASGRATGIVIRGTGGRSFEQTSSGCYASKHCADVSLTGTTCTGNHVMRADVLSPFIDRSQRRVTVAQPVSGATIPDGDAGGVALSQHVDTDGYVSYVTLNANLFHPDAGELTFYLEHNGRTVAIANKPQIWRGGEMRFSRTSFEFEGLPARGTWTLRVVDNVASGSRYQQVEWWQLVLGVTSSPAVAGPAPAEPTPTSATFVGSPCETDADCGFEQAGTPGFCYDFDTARGRYGFCSLPCQGYCPDRSGFAPTFCIASDSPDTGICVQQAHSLNRDCDAIEGTLATETPRFIGTSSAPQAMRRVCAPAP
jgi:V8-like Glu-specific endopeptidase/subtilisin-like proprotein convertase family protein